MMWLTKRHSIRKGIATVMVCSLLVVATPRPVYAWDAIFGSIAKQAFELLWNALEGLLKGIAKRLAVEMAVRQANKLTGNGNKNGPSFITDYKQYIYAAALDESMVFVNNFLTETLGGKYSGLVYVAATGNLQSLGRSYMSYLAAEANAGLRDSNPCRYTLDQYSNSPLTSLQAGDWKVFNALISNPCNNPTGYTNEVKKAFQEDLQRRAELARTKAIASQGFIGAEKNGVITAPGSILKDSISKATNMPMDLIAPAGSWGEILSAAAGAFMNQVITNLVQNGFESVAKKVDRELGKVDKKVMEARKEIEGSLGPGAYFLRNNIQQIGNTAAQNVRFGGSNGQQAEVQFNGTPGVCGTGDPAC